jgi:hypothetical protein
MDIQADELGITAPAIACRQDAGKLVRAVVTVLVRIIAPAERLASSLVGVLPVNEDCDSGFILSAPPVRPKPDGGEQCS